MSAGERESPSILESIRRDVRRQQRRRGEEPTGLLTPTEEREIQRNLQEFRERQIQRRVARRSPTDSTITRVGEGGRTTIEPATGLPEETQRELTPTGVNVGGTFIPGISLTPDLEAQQIETRRFRQRVRGETSPAAQLAGVAGPEEARAEQRFVEQEGLRQDLFRTGEVAQELARSGREQVEATLPLEEVGPKVGGRPVGKGVERVPALMAEAPGFIAGAALQAPTALTGISGRIGEQETAQQELEQLRTERGRLFRTGVRAAERQTVGFVREEPVTAALLFGVPAAGAVGRGARAARARAPARAVEAGARAREVAREVGARARRGVFGGRETFLARERAPEVGATRRFGVERAGPETSASEIVPQSQLTQADLSNILGEVGGRGRQAQTTIDLFAEKGRVTAEDVSIRGEAPSLSEIRALIERQRRARAERQGMKVEETETQIQQQFGRGEGFEVVVERRGTERPPRPELKTGEAFEVAEPVRMVGEKPIELAEGQTALPREVAVIERPNILQRLRGEQTRVEIVDPEAAQRISEPLETRGELQLLGRESRQVRERATGVEIGEGFRRVERPSFTVEGGGVEALQRPPLQPGFLFGLPPRGERGTIFDVETVGGLDSTVAEEVQMDVQERVMQRQQDLADVTGIQLQRLQPRERAFQRELTDLTPDLGELTGVREDALLGVRQRERQRQRERLRQRQRKRLRVPERVPRSDLVPTPRIPGPRIPGPFPGVPLVGSAPERRGREFTGFTEFQFEFELPTVQEFTFGFQDNGDNDDVLGGLTVL